MHQEIFSEVEKRRLVREIMMFLSAKYRMGDPEVSRGVSSPSQTSPQSNPHMVSLALGALGVVYGDIGTSPLYTIRECFYGPHSIGVSQANIMGVLSLIFYPTCILRKGKIGYGGFPMEMREMDSLDASRRSYEDSRICYCRRGEKGL